MTTRAAAVSNPNVHVHDDAGWLMVDWSGLLNGDDGAPVQLPAYADRSVQVAGTFGVGGTIVIEGSNNGTNYVTLRDVLGSAISLTAADIKTVLDLPRYIRPRVTAGDGTTSLAVTLIVRQQQR